MGRKKKTISEGVVNIQNYGGLRVCPQRHGLSTANENVLPGLHRHQK